MSTREDEAGVSKAHARQVTNTVANSIASRRQSFHAGIIRLNQSLEGIQVGHAHQDDAVAVHLSKAGYIAFWVMMLLARCCCIAFLLGTTRVYWFVSHPYMSYYASLLGPQAVEQFKPIGVCFGLVAAAHCWELVKMVYFSCRLRRFVLDAAPSQVQWNRGITPIQSFHAKPNKPHSLLLTAVASLHVRWRRLFHRRGFFGVESDFFHVRFLSRELIEIVSQTAQVYNSSVLIAKVWINNLYVVLMLVNCCSTPVLQAVFHKRPALERLLCLCTDFVLDAAVSIVVPIIIIAPYYAKFDFDNYNFEIAYLYDDIWFANMVMENQQIFALTSWDFVWKIVPHLSMYSCLSSLNALIRPAVCSRSTQTSSRVSNAWSSQLSLNSTGSERSCFAIEPLQNGASESVNRRNDDTTNHSADSVWPTDVPVTKPRKRLREWARKRSTRKMRTKGEGMLKAVNAVMVLWGLGILVLHILAIRTSMNFEVPGCKQVTRPWFARNFSCSVLQYNCHQYNTTDVRLEDLEILQEESVAALVFSHCPDLRVPAHIRKFKNLLGVDTYNSTLVEWNQDAAITNVTHTKLTYIIFVRVNMARLPDGVLQQLPQSMTDFEISVSNLTQLPDDLHERWGPMSIVYVEHSHIHEFPGTLRHLPVDDLSLIGNSISEIPEFPVGHSGFYTFAMTHTPLKRLPDYMGDPRAIGFLNLGYTQLESFPLWMNSVVKTATKIYVHHTPFCTDKSEQEINAKFSSNDVLTCTDVGDRQDGKYPLSLMDTRRPFEPSPRSN